MQNDKNTVFISYAKEDKPSARRLYKDLKNLGIEVWIDEIHLQPGTKWKNKITDTIRNSSFFIALISSKSINKRGFYQKEIREALLTTCEVPEKKTFIIPARLDDCEISNLKLDEYQWVDLFPSWDNGIEKIIKVILPENAFQSNKKVKEKVISLNNIENDSLLYIPPGKIEIDNLSYSFNAFFTLSNNIQQRSNYWEADNYCQKISARIPTIWELFVIMILSSTQYNEYKNILKLQNNELSFDSLIFNFGKYHWSSTLAKQNSLGEKSFFLTRGLSKTDIYNFLSYKKPTHLEDCFIQTASTRLDSVFRYVKDSE